MKQLVYDLKAIQARGLAMLLEVDELCAKYNLQYFLDSGTLLGAIRHKGFIPWDDDIDITMLREDYEKFLNIAPAVLPSYYFVQSNGSNPEFPFGFGRVLDTRSRFREGSNVKYRTGFCIDILPIDNAHDNRLIHSTRLLMTKTIQLLTKDKVDVTVSDYSNHLHKIAICIGICFGRFFPARSLMRWQERIATASNYTPTKHRSIFSNSVDLLNCLFPSNIYDDAEMVDFEGYRFPAPIGWHEYLTIVYGDYMKPPPPEERVPKHGFEKIVFDFESGAKPLNIVKGG